MATEKAAFRICNFVFPGHYSDFVNLTRLP